MTYYDRLYVSKDTDVNKTSESKECNICHYWYFLSKGFKFQQSVYNGWYDVLMMSMSLSNIAALNNKIADYCFVISGISKSEAINLLQNIYLTEENQTS